MKSIAVFSVVLATAGLLFCEVASSGSTVMVPGPHYVYTLTLNHKADLCSNMNEVFNDHFATPWDRPMRMKNDPAFAPDSPYAFPRLPGVDHDDGATFTMLADKVPSSPEFDAIQWKEGRAIFGEPKESAGPQNDTAMPILVASVDFYNDGHVDTVIKIQFTRGYSYFTNSGGVGLDDDLIKVIRKDDLPIGPVLSFYNLRQTVPSYLTSNLDATYQRLFRFEGKTYMARYDVDLGTNNSDMTHAPWRPHKELISILRYYLAADETQALQHETLCQFRMIQQPKRAPK